MADKDQIWACRRNYAKTELKEIIEQAYNLDFYPLTPSEQAKMTKAKKHLEDALRSWNDGHKESKSVFLRRE